MFTSSRDGVESIYWQAADGSGTPERLSLASTATPQGPQSFSRDGKRLVFSAPLDGGSSDLGVLTLDGERRADMLLDTSFIETNGVISPNGQWLAYQSNETGRYEVSIRPFPNINASKQTLSTNGGTRPLWSLDGRELFYYVEPATIMAVQIQFGSTLTLGTPAVTVQGKYASPNNAGRHYDVSPNGQRFLLLKDVEDADGKQAVKPQINIVLNWFEELKRLVPSK